MAPLSGSTRQPYTNFLFRAKLEKFQPITADPGVEIAKRWSGNSHSLEKYVLRNAAVRLVLLLKFRSVSGRCLLTAARERFTGRGMATVLRIC